MKTKEIILKSLHTLISKNVIGELQYASRYKGFIAELHFQNTLDHYLLNQNPIRRQYASGYFLPRQKSVPTLQSSTYFTVSTDHPDDYILLYEKIKKLDCENLFFIQWSHPQDITYWKKQDVMNNQKPLPIPNFFVYQYDCSMKRFNKITIDYFLGIYQDNPRVFKKDLPDSIYEQWFRKMSIFCDEHVLNLYVQRLIFDGYLGFGKIKGLPSDIDFIIEGKNLNNFTFFEVKEKDISKNKCFGMDIQRIYDLQKINLLTQCDLFYIVREIDNQQLRNFKAWRYIHIKKFIHHIDSKIFEGGTGMRSEHSSNPTQLCSEIHFAHWRVGEQ